MKKHQAVKGRPKSYADEDLVCVSSEEPSSALQKNSERRAIVNKIIDLGGSATTTTLNEHFGFDVSPSVKALIRAGWLKIVPAEAK